jgi:hypothetical protein
MVIEGEEMQAEGIENLLHKISAENFPNVEKEMVIQVQRILGCRTDQITKKLPPKHYN